LFGYAYFTVFYFTVQLSIQEICHLVLAYPTPLEFGRFGNRVAEILFSHQYFYFMSIGSGVVQNSIIPVSIPRYRGPPSISRSCEKSFPKESRAAPQPYNAAQLRKCAKTMLVFQGQNKLRPEKTPLGYIAQSAQDA